MISFFIALMAAVLSALGMGGGSVLLMYLTVVLGTDQLEAQGMNLAFFLPVAVVALVFHCKNKFVCVRPVVTIILFGSIGVFVGAYLAMQLEREILSKSFGVLLLIMGIRELLPRKKNVEE